MQHCPSVLFKSWMSKAIWNSFYSIRLFDLQTKSLGNILSTRVLNRLLDTKNTSVLHEYEGPIPQQWDSYNAHALCCHCPDKWGLCAFCAAISSWEKCRPRLYPVWLMGPHLWLRWLLRGNMYNMLSSCSIGGKWRAQALGVYTTVNGKGQLSIPARLKEIVSWLFMLAE